MTLILDDEKLSEVYIAALNFQKETLERSSLLNLKNPYFLLRFFKNKKVLEFHEIETVLNELKKNEFVKNSQSSNSNVARKTIDYIDKALSVETNNEEDKDYEDRLINASSEAGRQARQLLGIFLAHEKRVEKEDEHSPTKLQIDYTKDKITFLKNLPSSTDSKGLETFLKDTKKFMPKKFSRYMPLLSYAHNELFSNPISEWALRSMPINSTSNFFDDNSSEIQCSNTKSNSNSNDDMNPFADPLLSQKKPSYS